MFFYPTGREKCGANKQSDLKFKNVRGSRTNFNETITPVKDEDFALYFMTGVDNYLKMMEFVSKKTSIGKNSQADIHNGAAVLSYKYKTRGTKIGDWYIPSASELYRLCQNWNAIEEARKKCGVESLYNVSQILMTSGEYNESQYISFALTIDRSKSQGYVYNKSKLSPCITFLQIKK